MNMKKIEATGTIDEHGQVTFDQSVVITEPRNITVIFWIPEEESEPIKLISKEEIIDDIIQGLHEGLTGKGLPLSALWDDVDAD